jgi:hypothetical protein
VVVAVVIREGLARAKVDEVTLHSEVKGPGLQRHRPIIHEKPTPNDWVSINAAQEVPSPVDHDRQREPVVSVGPLVEAVREPIEKLPSFKPLGTLAMRG